MSSIVCSVSVGALSRGVGRESFGQHRAALDDTHLRLVVRKGARHRRVLAFFVEDCHEEAAVVLVLRRKPDTAFEVEGRHVHPRWHEEALQLRRRLLREACFDGGVVGVPLAPMPHAPALEPRTARKPR